jgi:hypothetical protein
MKQLFALVLLVAALAVTGCGEKKKPTPPAAPPAGAPENKPADAPKAP